MRSAPANDLAAARAARDITVSLGRASAAPSLDLLAGRVRHWTDRALAARDRLAVSDPEAAGAAIALWAFEAGIAGNSGNGGAP